MKSRRAISPPSSWGRALLTVLAVAWWAVPSSAAPPPCQPPPERPSWYPVLGDTLLCEGFENGVTAAPYAVFHGFGDVFKSFAGWVESQTGSRTHGHLFAPDRAEFSGNETMWAGALPDSAALRDYDPEAFLRNLIWNTQGEHQSFLLSPRDNLKIGQMLGL